MYKFKQLEWLSHTEFNGIYAEPYGLKCSYSIRVISNTHVQLSILDADYDYAPEYPPQFYNSIFLAQQAATSHYGRLLAQFII